MSITTKIDFLLHTIHTHIYIYYLQINRQCYDWDNENEEDPCEFICQGFIAHQNFGNHNKFKNKLCS